MDLTTFRARVSRVTGMSITNATDLALIDGWVNEAVIQFLKDTKMVEVPISMTFTADVSDYTLDATILSFMDAWAESADGGRPVLLEQISNADLLRKRFMVDSPDPPVMYYSFDGVDTLRVYPTPTSSSDTLHILYVPKPSQSLTAGSHTPSATAWGGIPERYHPVLEAYAKWKAAESEEHAPSQQGVTFMTMYEDGCRKAIATKNRMAGVTKGRARVGAPSNRVQYTPGTDLG